MDVQFVAKKIHDRPRFRDHRPVRRGTLEWHAAVGRDIVLLQAEFKVLPLVGKAKVQYRSLAILHIELELPVERPESYVELLLWSTCFMVRDSVVGLSLGQYVWSLNAG